MIEVTDSHLSFKWNGLSFIKKQLLKSDAMFLLDSFSELIKDKNSQEWINKIAEQIKPEILQKIEIVLMSNSIQSFIDRRLDEKVKSTIYLGTKSNSIDAIIGSLAHEIAHFIQPFPNLADKFYYKTCLKFTASKKLTHKLSQYIRFITLSTFWSESKTDKIGMILLKEAGIDPAYIKKMLKSLLTSKRLNTTNRIIVRMRLLKVYYNEKFQ